MNDVKKIAMWAAIVLALLVLAHASTGVGVICSNAPDLCRTKP